MQLRDGRLVLSPSDLNAFLECEHLSALELAVASRELERPAAESPQAGRIQGRLPKRMHVVLGTRERVSYRVRDFDAYFRRVRRRFLQWVADPPAT